MRQLWTFVRDPLNLAVLIAIGGAIGFLWNHYDKEKPQPSSDIQTAEAGKNAVNAAGQAQVRISGPIDEQPPAPIASPLRAPAAAAPAAGQVATSGSNAVNAKDRAGVEINDKR